jgi:hypothetical protein
MAALKNKKVLVPGGNGFLGQRIEAWQSAALGCLQLLTLSEWSRQARTITLATG